MAETQTPEKPSRKFPAPCWTQEETLALIEAYRERWYALRRGYLRTADWDAVAATLASGCPAAGPAKTSAQCRHKMEKLRQRYRAEKQRSLSFPGRFFSSWFFFNNMDSMENGPGQKAEDGVESGGGIRIRSLNDRDLVESVLGTKNCKKIGGKSRPGLGFDHDGIDPGGGICLKNTGDQNFGSLGIRAKNYTKFDTPNFGPRIANGYSSYVDDGSDEDADDDVDLSGGFCKEVPFDATLVAQEAKGKKTGKIQGNFKPSFDPYHDYSNGVNGVISGIGAKLPIDHNMIYPGLRAKKSGKFYGNLNTDYDCTDGEFCVKISGERISIPAELRAKSSGMADGNSSPKLDPRISNGLSSQLGIGLGKRSDSRGVKREGCPISEMVASIKMLGEGFAKMEKMKMEMAREVEKMRMEMEMKRNELVLESQRQIVHAFLTVLLENKKKKSDTMVMPEA